MSLKLLTNLIDWDGTNWADLPNLVLAADMVYNHVGRVLVGGWDGISDIIPTNVVYGTPYIHEFTYTLDDNFNPTGVDIVVLMIDAATGIIENAYQLPLESDILTADFSSDVVSGVAPLLVNFTDETQGGNITAWSWDFNSDGIEDSNEQNPSYTFETGGFFTVTLTVTNETGNSFTIVKEDYIHANFVGIENEIETKFKCYPNPTNSVINVQSTHDLSSILISNVSGQIVYTDYNCSSKLQTINISSFDKGIYFVKLSTEIETKIVKLVVN